MTSEISFYGNNTGFQVGQNHGNINFSTAAEADRLCIRALRCQDSRIIKDRLKETKDKLLPQSIEWVLQNPQYKSWRHGEDICLLWIKGGAGKGKTMISIGIVEELSQPQYQSRSTLVTYFFCQNANNELNTLEAIVKGLILQLVKQQPTLIQSLRHRWDTINNRFEEDVTSWRVLWNIFLEMLERCKCQRLYVIIDALDECQDDGMAEFFKLIVRNGLDRPGKIKWVLTSRPLESAERQLLAGHEQVQVSLELNSKSLSDAVNFYISYKVEELSLLHGYSKALKRTIEANLTEKAEGTFLWVSLVCKRLEGVCQDEALSTIQNLPPGLHPFYDRIFRQLSANEPAHGQTWKYMRLLKAMMLVYRPLRLEEVGSVTGLTDEADAIRALVHRCASFVNMQESSIQFVHQSARDYLTGENGQAIFDAHEDFDHDDITLGCLSYLSKSLTINLLQLPQPDSTREFLKTQTNSNRHMLLFSVDYAASFWVQHLVNTKRTTTVQFGLTENGVISKFLYTKLLEWLECLSLLDKLPHAIKALKELTKLTKSKESNSFAFSLAQDATRFLLKHYQAIAYWPLQIYSSASIFSPQSSLVRRVNIDKRPTWLRNVSPVEDNWTSLIQTLTGHSGPVSAVAFSPDGRHIASSSHDTTIKIWDATTGALQRTLAGHSDWVNAVAFSPDSKQVVSGSNDKTIKLWDATTSDLQKTLVGHSHKVNAVAWSPNGKQIASGSDDNTVKLWYSTGDLQSTLTGHSGWVNSVAFSPDSKQVASGSDDKTIKLWYGTGELQSTLAGHSGFVDAVAFSPDGKKIASGSHDKTIRLWDAKTGDFWKTLEGDSNRVNAVAFSPDSKQIVSGHWDGLINIWDVMTGSIKTTLGHRTNWVELNWREAQLAFATTITVTRGFKWMKYDSAFSVTFSPDSRQIASGFYDKTIKLWDTTTEDPQKKIPGHSEWVMVVAFSPDGNQITTLSGRSMRLWDSTTGGLQKTFTGIDKILKLPTYFYRVAIPWYFKRLWDYTIPTTSNSPGPSKNITFRNPQGISVRNWWVCYEGAPFLFIPRDYIPTCHDVNGDHIAIGFKNGRVMSFEIDRAILSSALGRTL